MHIDAGNHGPEPGPSLWSFREDVTIETGGDAGLTILTRWGDVSMSRPTPEVEEILRRMTFGPVRLANVAGVDQRLLQEVFDRLPGRIVRTLASPDSPMPMLSAQPLSPSAVLVLPDVPRDQPIRLSRFAFTHLGDGELVVESPLAQHRVLLHRPQAALVLGALARATTRADIERRVELTPAVITAIVAYLTGTGMVVLGEDGTDRFREDFDPALLLWSPYDLLFHSRSRLGRHDDPAGATFRHVGMLAAPPAVKPVPDGPRFPMYRPDPADHDLSGMTLTEAISRRRSDRDFAAAGPSARQLGELLFHVARVRLQKVVDGPGGIRYAVTSRPYPSAGSLYELELYLTVDRCTDLPRGIYHYSPVEHVLTLINTTPEVVDGVLDGARASIGSRRRPPVLTTIAARPGRVSWAYDSISYATTLQNVGVLQQTFYLAATVLGLAACAMTMGEAQVSVSAFDLDWPAEVNVGEFAVGLPETGMNHD